MKLFEAIASAVADEADGVAFGLLGDGNMPLWASIVDQGRVKMISARNEAAAVAMADGYFRATQRIGIALTTCGPGLTQAATSLVVASHNRSPIVLIAGDVPPGALNKLQDLDQKRFAEACGARSFSVSSADDAAAEISEAFFAARVNRCPVVLNLPMDVQEKSFDWDWEYRKSAEFLPLLQESASTEALLPIVDALEAAQRPVVIAGWGAKVGGARDAIVEVADCTGALLATSLQAKGLFEGHPYDIGIAGSFGSAPAEELLAEADFVLGIGATVGYFTGEGGLLFPSARIARIDIAPAPRELGTIPGLYVRGDALKSTSKLLGLLRERQVRKDGFRSANARKILSSPAFKIEPARDGLDQRVIMRALSQAIPDNAIVTCGVGHYFGFVASYLAAPGSVDFKFTCQFGAIGQTFANAIGVSLGTPGRPHLVIEGDGSLMFTLAEFDTAIRHDIPIVVLILNDGGYGAEVHKLTAKGFGIGIAQHGSPDLVALTRAFGGQGEVLKSEDDIGNALRRGLDTNRLYLIDARVSPSTMTDAYRRLHFGEPNRAPLLRRTKLEA